MTYIYFICINPAATCCAHLAGEALARLTSRLLAISRHYPLRLCTHPHLQPTAAAPSGRRQTASTAPLFTAPPRLPSSSRRRSSSLFTAPPRVPSSSCRRWWKTPFDVDARAERQTMKRMTVWFCP